MQHSKKLILAACTLFSLLVFPGCDPNNNYKLITPYTTGSMTATAGGTAFNAEISCTGNETIDSSYDIDGESNASSIVLSIKTANIVTGAYQLDSSTQHNWARYTAGSSDKMSMSGSVTISAIDMKGKTMTGTFNFTCVDGTKVTNGKFSAAIP